MGARSGHLVAIAIHAPTLAAAAVTLVRPVVTLLVAGGQVLAWETAEITHQNSLWESKRRRASVHQSVFPSHRAVSFPLASCWCWTVLLYKGNLKEGDKGLRWLKAQNCSSLLFSWRRLCLFELCCCSSCAVYIFFFFALVAPPLWSLHVTPLLEFHYMWQNQLDLCLHKTAVQVNPHSTQTRTLGFDTSCSTTGSLFDPLFYCNRIKNKAEANKCVVMIWKLGQVGLMFMFIVHLSSLPVLFWSRTRPLVLELDVLFACAPV